MPLAARLLVPYPSNSGYSLISALRENCEFICVVAEPNERLYVKSRLYDSYIELSLPRESWQRGHHLKETTEDERIYLDKMINVCRTERINVIWPTTEPVAYVFSKGLDRFRDEGIRVLAPEFKHLISATDKYLVTQAARKAEFPCPVTRLCYSSEDIETAVKEVGHPYVVKKRFSTASLGVNIIREGFEPEISQDDFANGVIVQEFIPGGIEKSLYFITDKQSRICCSFALNKIHHLAPSFLTAVEIDPVVAHAAAAEKLIGTLGLRGFVVIQTKVDPRTGECMLIEINPRVGNSTRIILTLYPEIKLALSQLLINDVRPLSPPSPSFGCSPIEDFISLLSVILFILYSSVSGSISNVPPIRAIFKSYRRLYASGPVFDINFRNFARDPLVIGKYYVSLAKNVLPGRERRRLISMIPWPPEQFDRDRR